VSSCSHYLSSEPLYGPYEMGQQFPTGPPVMGMRMSRKGTGVTTEDLFELLERIAEEIGVLQRFFALFELCARIRSREIRVLSRPRMGPTPYTSASLLLPRVQFPEVAGIAA
jgi:hypothetical protein